MTVKAELNLPVFRPFQQRFKMYLWLLKIYHHPDFVVDPCHWVVLRQLQLYLFFLRRKCSHTLPHVQAPGFIEVPVFEKNFKTLKPPSPSAILAKGRWLSILLGQRSGVDL